MGYKKITELPEGKYRDFAQYVQELGEKLAFEKINTTDAVLIGLCEEVRKLKEEVEETNKKHGDHTLTSLKAIEVRIISHTPDGPKVAILFNDGTSSCYLRAFKNCDEAELFKEGLISGLNWCGELLEEALNMPRWKRETTK